MYKFDEVVSTEIGIPGPFETPLPPLRVTKEEYHSPPRSVYTPS